MFSLSDGTKEIIILVNLNYCRFFLPAELLLVLKTKSVIDKSVGFFTNFFFSTVNYRTNMLAVKAGVF